MDAHALLTSQGWRGSGHSLHTSSDSIGLSRPLLVAQKQNTLGVGKKQHRTSDMWWMNAFDKSLKGLDTSKEGQVVQTVTNGGLEMVKKGGSKFVGSGGLYASFVRGEGLGGTLTPEDEETRVPVGEELSVKKMKEKRSKVAGETKEERKARKAARRGLSEVGDVAKSSSLPQPAERAENSDTPKETPEERRERRRLKKLARRQAVETASSESTERRNQRAAAAS